MTDEATGRIHPTVLWGLGLFVASLFFYASYCNRGMLLADEGSLVHSAQRVAQGQVPYRDFYHFYSPGSFYLLAAIFRVYRESFLASRAMWVVVRALCVLLTFLVARQYVKTGYALLPTAIILFVPGPWFKSFYAFSALLTFWMLLRYLERPRLSRLAGAALAVAAALLLRQDVGLEAGFVMGLGVLLQRAGRDHPLTWRPIGGHMAFAAGIIAAVIVPVLLYFHFEGALRAMWDQMFGMAPSYTLSKWRVIFKRFALAKDPAQTLMFAVPPAVILLGAVAWVVQAVRKGITSEGVRVLLLLAMSALTLLPAYAQLSAIRFYQCTALAWILVAAACAKAGERIASSSRAAGIAWHAAIAALCIGLIADILFVHRPHLASSGYTGTITAAFRGKQRAFVLRGERVYLNVKRGRELKELIQFIRAQTRPTDPIAVLPNQSMLYYLCDRPNPTRFIGNFLLKYPEEARDISLWQEWLEDMRSARPTFIIVHQKLLRKDRSFQTEKFLRRRFIEVRQFGEFIVMAPKAKGKQ